MRPHRSRPVPPYPGQANYQRQSTAIPARRRGVANFVFKAGELNPDYAAATYDDGIKMLATGAGAHYPMLSFAVSAIQQAYPDNLKDVGFFALPGDDASKNGLTAWMPPGNFALFRI